MSDPLAVRTERKASTGSDTPKKRFGERESHADAEKKREKMENKRGVERKGV